MSDEAIALLINQLNGKDNCKESDIHTCKSSYNIKHEMIYNDTAEYRQCIRELFYMKNVISFDDDIDDVTKDEMDYDEESIAKTMTTLFEITKNNIHFQQLYEAAAGKMFSTNHETGQAILFSYDYLFDFHHCIVAYLENPIGWTENVYYTKLKSRLLL